MIIKRITKKKYATDLTGKGAVLNGGCWNKIRTPVYSKQTFPLDPRLTKRL